MIANAMEIEAGDDIVITNAVCFRSDGFSVIGCDEQTGPWWKQGVANLFKTQ